MGSFLSSCMEFYTWSIAGHPSALNSRGGGEGREGRKWRERQFWNKVSFSRR